MSRDSHSINQTILKCALNYISVPVQRRDVYRTSVSASARHPFLRIDLKMPPILYYVSSLMFPPSNLMPPSQWVSVQCPPSLKFTPEMCSSLLSKFANAFVLVRRSSSSLTCFLCAAVRWTIHLQLLLPHLLHRLRNRAYTTHKQHCCQPISPMLLLTAL